MFTQRKKILILIVAILLLVILFYLWMINNRKSQESQLEKQAPLSTIKEPDSSKPVAEESEYYDSLEISYDLVGVIKEKGEDWVLIEDKTPQPPDREKEPLDLVKINISADTKIAKDKKLIDYQEVEVGDQALFKIQQEEDEFLATEFLISSL